MLGGGSGSDVLRVRKVIGPPVSEFVRRAGATPSFGWWSLACQEGAGGEALDIVSAAGLELRAHHWAMSRAWGKAASIRDRLSAQQQDVLDLLTNSALDELTDELLERAEDLLGDVPGLGTWVSWGWKLARHVERRVRDRREFQRDEGYADSVAEANDSAGFDFAAMIASLSHPKLPGVVAVEDAHLMSASMVSLVDHLSRGKPSRPVLVVLTAWPEADHESRPVFAGWLAQAVADGRAEVVDVPQLTASDLGMLVRETYPTTPADDAARLGAALGTPLAVKAWLSSPHAQAASNGADGLRVDGPLLEGLPRTVADLYAARWRGLAGNVQLGLMVALAGLPVDNPELRFLPRLLAGSAAVSGLDRARVDAGLARAVDPAGWCQRDGVLQWIREPLLVPVILQAMDGLDGLPAVQRQRIRESTCMVLRDWIAERVRANRWVADDREGCLTAARWLTELTGSEPPAYQEEVQAWTVVAQAITVAGDKPALVPARERLLEGKTRLLGEQHADTLDAIADLARANAGIGQNEKSILMWEKALKANTTTFGATSPRTLKVRHEFAKALQEAGKHSRALDEYRILIRDQTATLGPDDETTLQTRSDYARCLRDMWAYDDAVIEYQDLKQIYTRIHGPCLASGIVSHFGV